MFSRSTALPARLAASVLCCNTVLGGGDCVGREVAVLSGMLHKWYTRCGMCGSHNCASKYTSRQCSSKLKAVNSRA